MLTVIPLGTGSALPSKHLHFSATAVETEKGWFLFDCGEGTQHQLLHAKLRISRLKAICITHLHGDHCYGLPGLLSTLALLRHDKPLLLVGPAGIKSFIAALAPGEPANNWPFSLSIMELEQKTYQKTVFDADIARIHACPIEHSLPTFGYRIEAADKPGNLDIKKARALGLHDFKDYQKLKKGQAVRRTDGTLVHAKDVVSATKKGAVFAYITDTRPCKGGAQLARGANMIYHEATFLDTHLDRALRTQHSTAKEAAEIAANAAAGKLLIGHFSSLYKNSDILVQEAQSVFKNTEAAEELKRYVLPEDGQLTVQNTPTFGTDRQEAGPDSK